MGEYFTIHRLWEAADAQALLASIGPSIKAVAAGGATKQRVDAALLDRLPNVKIVSSFGVGYDHIDAGEAGKRGVVVTNTPNVLNEEVADTALGLLLATIRQLPQAETYLRQGKWLGGPFPLTATLQDRKIGIIGLGRIGKAIARRLEAFGRPIVYYGRTKQADVAYPYYSDLVAMAKDVDVLLSVLPGGKVTDKICGQAVFEALGPNGIFINIGRGTTVDEDALIAALRNKTILSAGLDVFADEPRVRSELIAMDHVVLLPHVGSATHFTRKAMGQLVIDNLAAWVQGKAPLTPVAETPWKG